MPDHRIIVVGLIWNQAGELLLCRMNPNRGVFPGQWGLPGGGITPGEKMEDALRREIREELGIEIDAIKPVFFKDGTYPKRLPNGETRLTYMIFLLFNCKAVDEKIRLNDEFVECRWVSQYEASNLDLNQETVDTLRHIGWGKGTH
jgi:nucleoside triphosphatase